MTDNNETKSPEEKIYKEASKNMLGTIFNVSKTFLTTNCDDNKLNELEAELISDWQNYKSLIAKMPVDPEFPFYIQFAVNSIIEEIAKRKRKDDHNE